MNLRSLYNNDYVTLKKEGGEVVALFQCGTASMSLCKVQIINHNFGYEVVSPHEVHPFWLQSGDKLRHKDGTIEVQVHNIGWGLSENLYVRTRTGETLFLSHIIENYELIQQ